MVRKQFPVSRHQRCISQFFGQNCEEWTVTAFVATDEKGMPLGFFRYAVNVESNEGFLASVIVDNKLRGKGCGKEMIQIKMLTEEPVALA